MNKGESTLYKWLQCSLLFLSLRSIAFSQLSFEQQFPALQRLDHFEHYTTEQGLSSNICRGLLVDSQGFLWISTFNGLNRFDGYKFEIFRHDARDSNSISTDSPSSILEDRSGTIWVGSRSGLNEFDRTTNKFYRYAHDPGDSTSLSDNAIRAIFEDHSGTLWIGTERGFNRVIRQNSTQPKHRARFARYVRGPGNADDRVYGIFEDSEGDLWIGRPKSEGCEKLDPGTGKFIHYPYYPRVPAVFQEKAVYRTYEDRSGVIWISTTEGLYAYDKRSGGLKHFKHDSRDSHSLTTDLVTGIYEDASGTIWVMSGAGLNEVDRKLGKVLRHQHNISNPHSLSGDDVVALTQDRSGNLWIATMDGINKMSLRARQLRTYVAEAEQMPSSGITVVASIKDNSIWLQHGQYLKLFDQTSKPRQWQMDSDWEREQGLYVLLETGNRKAWIGSNGYGLGELDMNSKRISFYKKTLTSKNPFSDNIVYSICPDTSGLFWVGTGSEGLCKFDPKNRSYIRQYDIDPSDTLRIRPGNARTLHIDKHGILWIGSGGLHRFDPNTERFVHWRHDETDSTSLSSDVIFAMCEDHDGNLWLGTGGGLDKFQKETGKIQRFYLGTGAGSLSPWAIIEDLKGNLWLGDREGGLSRFNIATGRFVTFTVRDGLPPFKFISKAYYRTNGEIVMGGFDGMFVFHPDSLRESSFIPPIVLTSLSILNKTTDLPVTHEGYNPLELRYDQNFFSFEFVGLDFTVPERIQYAYRLEGFEDDWNNVGNKHEAKYTKVSPGKYVFRVKSTNSDGVWHEKGTSIKIIITPPWWKTWWFTTFLWLAIVGLIGGGIRYIEMRKLKKRIQQLEHEQAIMQERDRTRDRIASDLHDDVASTLGSIALYTESLNRGLKSTSQPTRDLVQRINTLLNEAQDAVSDIVWSVTPRHDTLEDLLWRMKDLASDLCSANGIAYSVDIPKIMDVTNVSEKLRKGVYLIFKEAINNIIKHAHAKSVSVRVEIINSVFEMVIEDDGVGFITVEQRKGSSEVGQVDDHPIRGHGLRNMTKRAEEIGGKLSVCSTPGKGTTLRLSVSMT